MWTNFWQSFWSELPYLGKKFIFVGFTGHIFRSLWSTLNSEDLINVCFHLRDSSQWQSTDSICVRYMLYFSVHHLVNTSGVGLQSQQGRSGMWDAGRKYAANCRAIRNWLGVKASTADLIKLLIYVRRLLQIGEIVLKNNLCHLVIRIQCPQDFILSPDLLAENILYGRVIRAINM